MPTPAETFDCVLIDDDELVRLMWGLAAESAGKRLLSLAQAAEFWSWSSRLSASIPIYIDYNLPTRPSGDELARQLVGAGFTNLYFQTGCDAKSILLELRPWIRGVVGKDPPWL